MQLCKETVVCFVVLTAVAEWIVEARSVTRIKRDTQNDDNNMFDTQFTIERPVNNQRIHSVTVHHFARHVLCRRHEMRRDFYKALKDEYCMKDAFATELVVSLCIHKGDVLDQFVSDLLDKNKDGFINEHERNLLWDGK